MNIDFKPATEEPLSISIDLTSDIYAFEVPKSFLQIQVTSEGIIVDFFNGVDGNVIASYAGTYAEVYDGMMDRYEQRIRAMLNHPTSHTFDGGVKQ